MSAKITTPHAALTERVMRLASAFTAMKTLINGNDLSTTEDVAAIFEEYAFTTLEMHQALTSSEVQP